MKIGTSGLRYRGAYVAWDRLEVWAKSPQRSLTLLKITPTSVSVDPVKLMLEQSRIAIAHKLPEDEAMAVADLRAAKQMRFWLATLNEALARSISRRRVSRWAAPRIAEAQLQAAE